MKERIIGAAVLVLFVVLVVPVFLDGPPSESEIVSEPVLLPGQEDQETRTIVLDRDRTEPVPSNATEGPAQPTTREETPTVTEADEQPDAEPPAQEPVERPPVEEPATRPAEQPRATSTTGMWAVQLGSFSNKDNAEKLAADLRRQGYAAFLSQLETENGELHRVRIGPQKDRQSAEQMAARLLKVGHRGQVVPHP